MKQIFAFFMLCVICTQSYAQSEQVRITGKITDQETGAPLPGANIIIKDTYKGTLSDIEGEFSILVPSEGTTLLISFVGYIPQEIEVGSIPHIDISLSPETQTLDEVVITAQAKGQIGARSQQINANTLKNVVAPDRLQENPDANAVEAIGRLPGISVLRSGGEGSGLVIRGLQPRYSSVTLNGVKLPSSDGNDRSTNISGISQYALQGVEVFKALTADMEANSVAGAVNLTLQEAPKGLRGNIMAQSGYNHLNNYYGNYKLLGSVSNRFFDDKLGIIFSANAERVNRGVESLSAGYGIQSEEIDILLNSVNLNLINRINNRASATLTLDYQILPSTKLKLYGLYTHSSTDQDQQSISYGLQNAGSIGNNVNYNHDGFSEVMQTSFNGETNFKFLNMSLDYGLTYSKNKTENPGARSWSITYRLPPPEGTTTIDNRRLYPEDAIPSISSDSLNQYEVRQLSQSDNFMEDENLTANINLEIPFKAGDFLNGYIKIGGMYRNTKRFKDYNSGYQNVITNQYMTRFASEQLDFIDVVGLNDYITGENLEDDYISGMLDGDYHFGYTFNTDRLNQLTDWWLDLSKSYWDQGPQVWTNIFGERTKIGLAQNINASLMSDQDIQEDYYAGYFMSELNLGRWAMLLPGIRYEKTDAFLRGYEALKPTLPPNQYESTPGSEKEATRKSEYWLPMIHARIKPTKSFYIHMAYTQVLSRPDYNSISPNIYVDNGFQPFTYISTNPNLNAEFWTNYDIQATFHNPKVGLLSLSGFYKTVEDKIWNRTWTRIKGDSIIPYFTNNDVVNVTEWSNHPYDVYLKGLEFEWQTSFWYLPKPFKYFTLYLNYTYTESETQYPTTEIVNVTPPEGGRPVATRFDSTTTGPMLYQPKHIANASLGFNYNDFNLWLSFQYNGEIYTGKNYRVDELDPLKEHFYRLDLQLTQGFEFKSLPGKFEVLANFANLTNFEEFRRLRGDSRPTYREAYGWTVDLGVRYKF